jgi:hypothetical protein
MALTKVSNKGLANDAVTADKIADGTVVASDIADGTITTAKIAADAIDGTKIADDAIDSEHITDGSVDNVHLAGSIANDKLANSSITINGTSIALGASGDITAGLDWQSVKINTDSPISATSGEGYFLDTTSGTITINLPASPSLGDFVGITDVANQFNTNNVTVGRNGSNIEGSAQDDTIAAFGANRTYVYSGATYGWVTVNSDGTDPAYIVASGGTETTSGDYKIHSFTSSGCFSVTSLGNDAGGGEDVSYLIIAGGGGGGDGRGGGGGAGGYREGKLSTDTYSASPLDAGSGATLSTGTYPVVIGSGGGGATSGDTKGSAGSPSSFNSITSQAGGYGGAVNPSPSEKLGGPGGSGGGAGGTFTSGDGTNPGGSGNTPPVSPPQGNNGGNGVNNGPPNTGGASSHGATGGGAGGAGTPATGTPAPGTGGPGVASSITGSPVTRGGGGGGASDTGATPGGPGGGGDGLISTTPAKNGTANTGGGGGGVRVSRGGGNGGSGIVVIRYQYQ